MCAVSAKSVIVAEGRHSYVPFYPSDWLGGTARLPRLHKSVFFDICCYIWDHAKPCPDVEAEVMVSDLKNGSKIIDDLVKMGKLSRGMDGSLSNTKALAEAEKAFALWEAKSKGGKGGAEKRWKSPGKLKHSQKTAKGTPKKRGNSTPIKRANAEPEPEQKPPKSPLRKRSPSQSRSDTGSCDGRSDRGGDPKPIGDVLKSMSGRGKKKRKDDK